MNITLKRKMSITKTLPSQFMVRIPEDPAAERGEGAMLVAMRRSSRGTGAPAAERLPRL
jgi:hypothetical protein